MKIYNSIIELTGSTPLVRVKKIEDKYQLDNTILVKLEMFNPSGSVKIRPAKSMVLKALHDGLITEKSVLIEPTSGNMGIAIALVAASLGMKFIAVMPQNMSVERQKLIKAYGAEVILTEAKDGMNGAVKKAKELAMELDGFILSQFDNLNNPLAHYESTAKEIVEDTNGWVDIVVSGVGTGGTISGVARYIKKLKDVKMIGVEPQSSPLLTSGVSGPHKIQGIGANFIPNTLDLSMVDDVVDVTDAKAIELSRELAFLEGIFVGVSSGAAMAGTIDYIKKNNLKDKTIVVILPDTGERYLSTDLIYEE